MLSNNVDLLNDMNTLMKGVKKREELHLSLADYIKRIISNRDDSSMFIEEEIRAHRLFQSELLSKEQKVRDEEGVLREKYAGRVRLEQAEVKFIGRLSMRILEICQASLQKLKQLFSLYEDSHTVFQESINKQLQSEHLDLEQLIKSTLEYSRGKFDEDAASLQKMIEMIEKGEKDMIGRVMEDRQDKRTAGIQAKKLQQQRRRRQLIVESETQHRKEKEKLADRLFKIKEQAKQVQKTRKRKTKYFQKVYTKAYGVLEADRRDLMDQIIFVCKPEEQYKRLYTQILQRNKCVQEQIAEFNTKAQDIKQKIRKFKESMLFSPLLRPRSKVLSCSMDIPIVCSSMECLTTTAAETRIKDTKEIITQRLAQLQEPESASAISSPLVRRQRKSVQSNLQRRVEVRTDLHHRFPVIATPFMERRQRRQRYQQLVSKARRFSQVKNDSPATTMRESSRVMQVPLIQLNMVQKFEFKVHEPPRKKEVISKAFEYTFHFNKRRENRFQQGRNNFVV